MGLVKQQKYDEFLNLLNKTSLPSGMKLGMKECIRQGNGDRRRLPLWWHDNYNKRDYIYSKEDINKITHFVDRNFDASVLVNYDLAQEIYGENGRYYISCCYWTDFGGLKREYVEISLLDGKLDKIHFPPFIGLYRHRVGTLWNFREK